MENGRRKRGLEKCISLLLEVSLPRGDAFRAALGCD
jgi:hypothetical protein